jgi:hypothetical protein
MIRDHVDLADPCVSFLTPFGDDHCVPRLGRSIPHLAAVLRAPDHVVLAAIDDGTVRLASRHASIVSADNSQLLSARRLPPSFEPGGLRATALVNRHL